MRDFIHLALLIAFLAILIIAFPHCSNTNVISQKEAILLAEEALHHRKAHISQASKVQTELKYGLYIITFPREPLSIHRPNGYTIYDAQVILNAHTGEVKQLLMGE